DRVPAPGLLDVEVDVAGLDEGHDGRPYRSVVPPRSPTGYGPQSWITRTPSSAACSTSAPSTSSRPGAARTRRARPRSGRPWWTGPPTSAARPTPASLALRASPG